MNCQPIELNKQSSLIKDYRNRDERIYTHFHYDPYHLKNFKKRYQYLTEQSYQRDQLADVLLEQNKRWGAPESVVNQIDSLRNPNSVVVIGGQQAGLLTGPVYTINKIISIILQAKEQSEYLGQPVIPVFWIAGEDHDFEEINHIYSHQDHQLVKRKLSANESDKIPVSKRMISSEKITEWLDEVFSSLQETEYTKDLYRLINSTFDDQDSYVDFFAKIIHRLFEEEGLILVDSDDVNLRHLEKDYFKAILKSQPEIANTVVEQLMALEEKGYSISLDATTEDGHLFYHLNGERLLLEVDEGKWVSKDQRVAFSQEELLEELNNHPENFSNNVVTRPLMQEMVFPVLSFIGGPGEIGYWSALKPAFEALDLQFPIITPRLSITLLDSKHKSFMDRYGIELGQVINEGSVSYKLNWLKKQTSAPIEELMDQVKAEIKTSHQPVQELAAEIQSDLGGFAESNLRIIHTELEKLEKRMLSEVKRKHQQTVEKFDELNTYYYPNKGLQERVWNIVPFMNEYGLNLPQKLATIPPRWEQDHLVVQL